MIKLYSSTLILICCILFSCQDEKQREVEIARDLKKREVVFESVSKNWSFQTQPINPSSQNALSTWKEWRDLMREFSQKPQSSITAFQKKAKNLTTLAAKLPTTMPAIYDIPEMKSRISVLLTKINSLNLYINLDVITDQKVHQVIDEVNSELLSVQKQMDEIDRKGRIPREEGESEMIKMLDTSRAVPTKKQAILIEQDKIIK